MGVTIHFQGQLTSEAGYRDLIVTVSSFAKAEGWPIDPIQEKEVTLLRVRDEKDWDYIGPVKGVVVRLHNDCDPVRFEFDRNLYVQEFAKTQFVGPDTHLKLLKLLRAVTPFFSDLQVEDEGEYWETGNLETLTAHIDSARNAIDAELKKNPSAQMKVKTPSGKIIDLIT